MKNTTEAQSNSIPPRSAILSFRRKVYTFYRLHGRHELPWRHTDSAYHILVSEIMLQQTQVNRVIDKYERFIAEFPSVAKLSRAPLERVLRAWQGLGYNRRGMMLQKCANQIQSEFGGEVPSSPENLEQLAGIGPATARSIAAFAFNRPEIFIETNIRTVYIHHFFEEAEGVRDEDILPVAADALDRKNPRRWYSALMDYGTELKRRFPNPSRRSAHHTKQSKFEGSDRQIRGRILRHLLQVASVSEPTLLKTIGSNPARTKTILTRMAEEGLIQVGKRISIGT